MKLTPSVNKTFKGSWNNFDSKNLDKFVKDFHPDFVDSDEQCWENCEDTAVFTMPFQITWEVVGAVNDLRPDEFAYEKIDDDKVVIRLWWD